MQPGEIARDPKFDALVGCLSEHGCSVDHLRLTNVAGAGRGLVAAERIRPNSYILRLTENVLVTTATVLQSAVGPAVAKHPGILNAFDALCLFLISESARKSVSPWRPFLDVLPDEASVLALAFTVDTDLQEKAASLLPPKCRSKFEEQLREVSSCRRRVLKVWSEAKRLLELHSVTEAEDERLFRWSWSCVNSRCIFKENTRPSPLLDNSDGDTIAMAPFLDMLNHSALAKVECGFCSHTRTFDVFTQIGVAEGDEVFICYGLHSNALLLLEYGFVLKENPNNTVYIENDDLKRLCSKANVEVSEKHWEVLKESKLPCPLYQTDPEPPWTFMATMKLLSMKEDDLKNWLRIYDFATFEEPQLFVLARIILEQYLAELEIACPISESLAVFPKRFHSMIMQVWRDDISVLSDSLAYLTKLLSDTDTIGT